MPILLPNAQQAQLIDLRRESFNRHEIVMANQHGLPYEVSAMRAAFAANDPRIHIGNASPLPKDVWGEWDRESVQIQRDVLAVFNDLAGSVATPIDIGKLIHYFRQVSDSGVVNISLDGRSKAKTDQQVYSYVGTPVPIIDSTFSYGWRQMRAAQTAGEQLDADGRDNANRKVAEKLEDIVLNGDSSVVVNGQRLWGLRNHPKRSSRNTAVTLAGATGAQWVTEIVATLQMLNADSFFEPATIYLNISDWLYAQRTQFTANYPMTIADHILKIAGVGQIVAGSKVPASNILAVIKRRQVVQLLSAMPMSTTALFRANPQDDYNFQTLAAAALEIKYDGSTAEHCGIATSIPS